MRTLRYFSHPPLAFWTLTTVLLAGMFVIAANTGSATPTWPAIDSANSTNTVLSLHARTPTLVRLTNDPDERLSEWSRDTAHIAHAAADRESVSTYRDTFTAVGTAADKLAATDPDDTGQIERHTSDLLDALDQLTAIWIHPNPEV